MLPVFSLQRQHHGHGQIRSRLKAHTTKTRCHVVLYNITWYYVAGMKAVVSP